MRWVPKIKIERVIVIPTRPYGGCKCPLPRRNLSTGGEVPERGRDGGKESINPSWMGSTREGSPSCCVLVYARYENSVTVRLPRLLTHCLSRIVCFFIRLFLYLVQLSLTLFYRRGFSCLFRGPVPFDNM